MGISTDAAVMADSRKGFRNGIQAVVITCS